MSWVGPSISGGSNSTESKAKKDESASYRCLVVDSGPIIKHTGFSKLFGIAEEYYTVPGVMNEIRDAKARQHLDQWPMDLIVKEPTTESINAVVKFSKLTGDYPSLSTVDLQVLALTLDLERDGCLSLDHIRSTPKRKIGLGPLENLGGK